MDFEIYLIPNKGEPELDLPIDEIKKDDQIYLSNPRIKHLDKFYNIKNPRKLIPFSELPNFSEVLISATGINNNDISSIIKGIINATIKTNELVGYLSEDKVKIENFDRLFNNRDYKTEDEYDSLDAAVQLYQQDYIQVCINGKNNKLGYLPTQKLTTLLSDYSRAIK